MRRIHSLGIASVLFLAFAAAPCLSEEAAPAVPPSPPAAGTSDAYRQAEKEARDKYQYEVETARQRYGEGSADYQTAITRAGDEYRRQVAASAAEPGAAVTPTPAPAAATPVTAQEQTDWDAFKEKSKEASRAVGRGAEKAGDAVERGAKRVGKFFKDGYEDITN